MMWAHGDVWSKIRKIAAAATLTILFTLPVSFVQLSPQLDRLNQLLVAACIVLFILHLIVFAQLQGKLFALAFGLVIGLLGATMVTHDPYRSLNVIGPVMIGLYLCFAMGKRAVAKTLAWLWLAACLTIFADGLLGPTWTISFFGKQLETTYSDSIFRARGFVGQPLAAGMLCAIFALALLRLNPASKVRATLILTVSIVAVTLTGTRSALLLLIAGAVIIGASKIRTLWLSRTPLKMNAWSWAVLFLLIPSLTLGVTVSSWGPQSLRVFDVQDTSTSVSFTNRGTAWDVLQDFLTRSDLPGLVLGHGPRDLQSVLPTTINVGGLSTIDNLYVTLAWDSGLLGLFLLFGALYLALQNKGPAEPSNAPGLRDAAKTGLLAFFASGLAFDVLYTRPAALLFGLLLGSAIDFPERQGRKWQHRSAQAPSTELLQTTQSR